MNMKLLGTSAVAAVLLAAPAFAATYTFDDFTTAQIAAAQPTTSNTVAGGPGTGFTAASRTFTTENTAFQGDPIGATELQSFGGILAFNNNSGARGKGTITYDGVGDLMNSREKGAFLFEVIDFDGNAEFAVTGQDNFGNTISYFEDLASGFSATLRFSEFTGYETFDFSNVAFLNFSIDSTNTANDIDGRLGSIQVSAVPVPASGLLLIGALGGAAALRRRKARKTA